MTELSPLQQKKVLFVFGNLELGGAERQGLLLAESLKNDYGADVRVWGLADKPGIISELCDRKGIPWRAVRCGWGRYWFTRIVKLSRFAVVLRAERPDIIVSYTRLPNLICALTWKFSGAQTMVWNQRDEGLLLTGGFWERLAVRCVPHFISNSGMGKAFLERMYRLPSKKIQVIPNGVTVADPVTSSEEWRSRLGVTPGVRVACMVANIHPYKDHHTLLRAWAQLSVPNQPLPVLVLAGRVDEGGEELMHLAKDLGIGRQVLFAGKVDDVAGLLRSVDLLVHSSRSEGLPNAVLEAMATGLPVVGTDIPGIREAVGPGGEKFLAPAGDAELLAARINVVLQDDGLRQKLGQAMQRRAREFFSTAAMCSHTAALLSSTVTVGAIPADSSC